MKTACLFAILMVLVGWPSTLAETPAIEVTIGSKQFTESVILGELVTLLLPSAGVQSLHRQELGGTRVLWDALVNGDLDVYPEYTGTLRKEIFANIEIPDDQRLQQLLAERGIRMSQSLGFNDTYAIGTKKEVANRLGIRTISDLRKHPELKFGFSSEFMDRGDGWPGLRDRYQLPQRSVQGLDHDLAYRGLESGAIDATDLYSTDAEIQYYKLQVLEDDLQHFPPYRAVLLYREDLLKRAPSVVAALLKLEGRISETAMVNMNLRAKLDKVPETRVAADFLKEALGIQVSAHQETTSQRLWRTTKEHLYLVCVSLAGAIVVAVPLGIWAVKQPTLGQAILATVGIIQTIPALALLVLLIKPLSALGLQGLGTSPAIVALFLYSLLPIVRNTYAGLHDVPPYIHESAVALGLPASARLWLVELPMASRTILAGIKTSAVINVGFATLGALIGAGGYGQPILTGIRLNRYGLILQGALPAAGLALLVQVFWELVDRVLVPKGLHLNGRA